MGETTALRPGKPKKLNDKQRGLIALMKRSKPDAEGWMKVSAPVWPLLAPLPDDLIERRKEDVGGYVRFTERGKAVADYL